MQSSFLASICRATPQSLRCVARHSKWPLGLLGGGQSLRAGGFGHFIPPCRWVVDDHRANAARGLWANRAMSSVPERSQAYAQVEERDVVYFRGLLGAAGVITDSDDLVPYNTDWMKKYHGQSRLALRPKTTEQVARIMEYCNERSLAVVPQGGNTGLVGGSIPLFDEIVLSLSSMDKVISFDDHSGVVVCEAGCILQNLESFVNELGYMVPLDLGAKGTCQIGGNVATNAGGLRLVRYGSLKGSVLGLEAVLADGTVLDTLNTLRKDNTGFDVKQLLIGSEGSLAVITKVGKVTESKRIHAPTRRPPYLPASSGINRCDLEI